MASLIPCPHCGARPREEFTVRGEALARPATDAGDDAWHDHVYLRDNPRGAYDEYWHHSGGCRRWLVVSRNTMSHAVIACRDASLQPEGSA